MKILGIETSCDETAASIVELADINSGAILHSNVVFSSMDLHAVYGGVVPEIAARSHIEAIMPVIEQATQQAGCNWEQIDGIAVTYGAGLGGSLLIGVLTARTLAIIKQKPLYAINHVEGHIYANFITKSAYDVERIAYNGNKSENEANRNTLYGPRTTMLTGSPRPHYILPKEQPEFPMLGLIVSGGHSQLVLWRDHFDYTLLGQTRDDAIGEAFDKVAKILGLPYPGGPSVEAAARKGDPFKYSFPKAKVPGKYNFSFSGLKTAVLRMAQAEIGENYTYPSSKLPERLSDKQKNDIAASFQRIAIETVADKTLLAYDEFEPASVVIGGGVAASPALRQQLAERLPLPIVYQDPKLMTDNGAMIATLGCYKAMLHKAAADPYALDIQPNLSM